MRLEDEAFFQCDGCYEYCEMGFENLKLHKSIIHGCQIEMERRKAVVCTVCTDLNEESEGLDLPPDCLGGSNTDPTSTETNPKAAKHKDPQNGLKDSEDSSNVLSYISVKMFFYWNFIKNNI